MTGVAGVLSLHGSHAALHLRVGRGVSSREVHTDHLPEVALAARLAPTVRASHPAAAAAAPRVPVLLFDVRLQLRVLRHAVGRHGVGVAGRTVHVVGRGGHLVHGGRHPHLRRQVMVAVLGPQPGGGHLRRGHGGVLLVGVRVVRVSHHRVAVGHVAVHVHRVHVPAHLLHLAGRHAGQGVLVLLHQRLGLAARPVFVIRMFLHMDGAQPLGFVDEGPLLRLR